MMNENVKDYIRIVATVTVALGLTFSLAAAILKAKKQEKGTVLKNNLDYIKEEKVVSLDSSVIEPKDTFWIHRVDYAIGLVDDPSIRNIEIINVNGKCYISFYLENIGEPFIEEIECLD
jgi:hypothetical protein